MSSPGTTLHTKTLPLETERAQRVPDMDAAQQLKLRERQRFFEEVFQHDVDVYLSSAHLQIDYKRPPIGSISSMEVNVDMLEQMELMDISDQDVLDVFLSSGGEEGGQASPSPANGKNNNNDDEDDEVTNNELSRHISDASDGKSRMSSISSTSSSTSQDSSEDGRDTPVVQSDDEDASPDTRMDTPPGKAEEDRSVLSP